MSLIWLAAISPKAPAFLPELERIANELGPKVPSLRSWSWGQAYEPLGDKAQLCMVGEFSDDQRLKEAAGHPDIAYASGRLLELASGWQAAVDVDGVFPSPISADWHRVTYAAFLRFHDGVTDERRRRVKAEVLTLPALISDICGGSVGWCSRDMAVPWHLAFTWKFASKEGVQRYFRDPYHGLLYQRVRDSFESTNANFSHRPTHGDQATDELLDPVRHLVIVRPDTTANDDLDSQVGKVTSAHALTMGLLSEHTLFDASVLSPFATGRALIVDFDTQPNEDFHTLLRKIVNRQQCDPNSTPLHVSYQPKYPRLLHVIPGEEGHLELLNPPHPR